MNILILTSCYFPDPDSALGETGTTVIKDFAFGFSRLGHRVFVVHNYTKTPFYLKLAPKWLIKWANSRLGYNLSYRFINTARNSALIWTESYGVRVARFPLARMIPKKPFSERQIDKQYQIILRWLDSEGFVPDEVIGHWEDPQLGLLRRFKEDFGIHTTYTSHGCVYLDRSCGKKMLEDLGHIDEVFGRNQSSSKRIQELLGRDLQVPVCQSGIEDCFFEGKAKLRDRKSYIYVGRLVAYKHLDIVIKALADRYGSGGFSLIVVGTGSELENMERLARELSVQKDVIFVGQKSREELVELYSSSSVFLMPSEGEMYGLVYLEAMACGCVTVAGSDGGMVGIIRSGKNGYLCDPGDVASLIDVLIEIDSLSDIEIDNLRLEARRTAKGFSIVEQSNLYLEMIRH